MTPVLVFSGSAALSSGPQLGDVDLKNYARIEIQFEVLTYNWTAIFETRGSDDVLHSTSNQFVYAADTVFREVFVNFKTSGKYLYNPKAYISYNREAYTDVAASVYIKRVIGYKK